LSERVQVADRVFVNLKVDIAQYVPHFVDGHIIGHAPNTLERHLSIQFDFNMK
jgi:hypothetical protein